MKTDASGFTLVEIAIVLVIIGLLLGGVLKGQELVNSAKVKNHVGDFKAVPLFIYGYQDKYKALPGDDRAAATHVGAGATLVPTAATLGNGRIDGNFNSEAKSDESLAFWQQVRLANLAAGATDFSDAAIAASVPRNADGGRIGVQSAVPIAGMAGTYFVCSDGIPGRIAKQIDTTMDDGNTATGSVRVGAHGYAGTMLAALPLTGSGAVVDDAPYTVCAAF
ncbi:prepilin-type N-terminal cleavage/methylation domain-containing protein [Azospira restricta]|uniref:Prepilin-type N-terminal cleavage/methylation domain-containing protein n=1 Tax=Azospira restricta TaxID=404405 RepID=A0A974SRR5_9RHOO|nr:prepilin-type N-terminal cleavage/methylation domain-containing protein [Azospira restricta]QRJ65204.1 prepilin-type N-terminal cleavage/methylation domain-containing protein [Azospira restricta]